MRRFLCSLVAIAVPPISIAQLPLPQVPPAQLPTPTPPGQVPPVAKAKHSISFEVKVVRSGAASDLDQGNRTSGLGSTTTNSTTTLDRRKDAQMELEIGLRSFSSQEDAVSVDTLFFAELIGTTRENYGGKNDLKVLTEKTQDVVFKPGGTQKLRVESDRAVRTESKRTEVQTRDTGTTRTTSYAASNLKGGIKITGYLVRVRAGDEVLGIKASAPRFEQIARTAGALDALERIDQNGMPKYRR